MLISLKKVLKRTLQQNFITISAFLILTGLLFFSFYGIYPDEIANQIWSTRIIQDFPFKLSVFPQCKNTFAYELPLSLYPAASIMSPFVYINDIWLFRLTMLCLFACVLALIWRAFKNLNYNIIYFWAFTFCAFGTVKLIPFIIFRVEIFVALFLSHAVYKLSKNDSKIFDAMLSAMLFGIVCLNHPLAVYLTPLAILSVWPSRILVIYVLVASFQTYEMSVAQFFNCDDLLVTNKTASMNISPLIFLNDPLNFLEELSKQLSFENIWKISIGVGLLDSFANQSNYFPGFASLQLPKIFIQFISLVNILIFWLSAILTLFCIWYCFREKINRPKNKLLIFCGLLFIFSFGHMILNKTAAFYAVGMWNFCYVLTFFLLFAKLEPVLIPKPLRAQKIILFKICFLTVLLASTTISSLHAGRVFYWTGPNIPLNQCCRPTNDEILSARKEISKVSKKKLTYVIVDDIGYFIAKDLIRFPLPITYLNWTGTRTELIERYDAKISIGACGSHLSVKKWNGDVGKVIVKKPDPNRSICLKEL